MADNSWWSMEVDVKTGDAVPVIKVGIDQAGDSACNQVVRGTQQDAQGVVRADTVKVSPARTAPVRG